MAVQWFERSIQGFAGFGLRNEQVEVVVIPELGAKVLSLRNLRSGREWMWSPPEGAVLRRPAQGADFSQSGLSGADECLPTIAPCTWRDVTLPDHGEAWSAVWDVDRLALAHGRIVTRVRLEQTPLWFERILDLRDRVVTLEYALRNLEPTPHEFVWAFHPLLWIEDGDRLLLPPDCRWVRTEAAIGCPLGRRGDLWRWPSPASTIQLDALDLGQDGAAVKLFSEPLQTGMAAVQNSDTGDELRFEFEPATVNTLGIWINRGGWNGYHHLAVEPGIGAPDPLDVAVEEWRRYGLARPGETLRWSVRLALAP